MYQDLKHIIARKAESQPGSLTNTPTQLDAVELTSILSASGFHLDHFDIDRDARAATAEAGVCVTITCQRSGIVSRMHQASAAGCTCPTEEVCSARNAIWDVQGATPGGSAAPAVEAVQSSSSLLPQLSPRKVQITKHLIKVMLEVFEAKDENGNIVNKCLSTTANNNNNNSPRQANQNNIAHLAVTPLTANGIAHLPQTPVSSINVTPKGPSDFVAEVVGLPKVLLLGQNGASPEQAAAASGANATANGTLGFGGAENLSGTLFTSPSSDMFTSSPNTTPQQIRALPVAERDQVVASLRQIRENIDSTLAMLDFDATRNISTISMRAPPAKPTYGATRPNALPLGGLKSSKLSIPSIPVARRHSLAGLPAVGAAARTAATAAAASSTARRSIAPSIPGPSRANASRGPANGDTSRRSLLQTRTKSGGGAAPTLVSTPRPKADAAKGAGVAAAPVTLANRQSLLTRSSLAPRTAPKSAAKAATKATGAANLSVSSTKTTQRNPMMRADTFKVPTNEATTSSTSSLASTASSSSTSTVSAASTSSAPATSVPPSSRAN